MSLLSGGGAVSPPPDLNANLRRAKLPYRGPANDMEAQFKKWPLCGED